MKRYITIAFGIIIGVLIIFLVTSAYMQEYNDSTAVVSQEPPSETKNDETRNVEEKQVKRDTTHTKLFGDVHSIMMRKYMFSNDEDMGGVIHEKSFKVFSVISPSAAYVYGKDEYGSYRGTVYLLEQSALDVEQKRATPFYDDLIIKVQKGQEVRMFGTHTYTTRSGNSKTVPVIRIMNK